MPTLSQEEFMPLANDWLKFVQDANSDWSSKFLDVSTGTIQAFVKFNLEDSIVPLLSTPRIDRVIARFILQKSYPEPNFRVVLCAVSKDGNRISPYYQGESSFIKSADLPKGGSTDSTDIDSGGEEIPYDISQVWQDAWVSNALAGNTNGAQFTTSFGPLLGYDFPVNDFVDALFKAGKSPAEKSKYELWMMFGLKTYNEAFTANPDSPSQLFSLLVRLVNTKTNKQSGGAYDMSSPMPPGH